MEIWVRVVKALLPPAGRRSGMVFIFIFAAAASLKA